MYYEVKNKISSSLVQSIVFFNETKRTATEFEGLEKKRIYRTVRVNSTGYLLQRCKIDIFSSNFLPSLH